MTLVYVVMAVTTKVMTKAMVAQVLDRLAAHRGAGSDGDRISRIGTVDDQIAPDRAFDIDCVVAITKQRDQAAGDCRAVGERDVVVPAAAVVDHAAVDGAL